MNNKNESDIKENIANHQKVDKDITELINNGKSANFAKYLYVFAILLAILVILNYSSLSLGIGKSSYESIADNLTVRELRHFVGNLGWSIFLVGMGISGIVTRISFGFSLTNLRGGKPQIDDHVKLNTLFVTDDEAVKWGALFIIIGLLFVYGELKVLPEVVQYFSQFV